MVLVADADMLNDGAAVDVQEVFGRRIVVPSNGNLAFAQGLVEQFASDDALMSLRSRADAFRPLTVVREMQASAQKQYLGRLKALEDELQKTTDKLQELQKSGGGAAKGALIMTPEQQAEIENFRTRVTETRKELKELRKNLRQDAEALVFWTKLLNIALMPLLVVLAGLAVFLVRKQEHSGVNARVVAVLVVLLAALGGGALLVRQQADSQKPADAASLGQPLFKGLQAASVAAVAIRQPKASITIENKGDRWIIAERDGFPADYDKVRDFVLKAIALKVGQSEPIGEKDRARLLLDAGRHRDRIARRRRQAARPAHGRQEILQGRAGEPGKGDRRRALRRAAGRRQARHRGLRPARAGLDQDRRLDQQGRDRGGQDEAHWSCDRRTAAPGKSSARATTPTGSSPARAATRSSKSARRMRRPTPSAGSNSPTWRRSP